MTQELESPEKANGRFCHDCGHGLPHASVTRCPACGSLLHRIGNRGNGASGRWLAGSVIALGVVLSLIALKYQQDDPKARPVSQPFGATR